MLSGEHRDVLLNTKTGEVKGLSIARVSLPTGTEPRSGFLTAGESIWCIGSLQMTDLVSGEQIELPATNLLPLNTRTDAADVSCLEGHLQIPFGNGFRYIDILQRTYTDIPCKFDFEKNEGLSLRMPVLVPGTDKVFAVQGTAVMVFSAGKWDTCLIAETEPSPSSGTFHRLVEKSPFTCTSLATFWPVITSSKPTKDHLSPKND